jgi:hypothetical protein
MNPKLLEQPTAARGATSPPRRSGGPDRTREAGATPTHDHPGRGVESIRDRRLRSEALARSLAGAADIGELVAIINEHGRPAAARAAAVRPDLVPLINGEFPHIALSLADLD